MIAVGCRADVITCNSLIGGLCKTRKISFSIKLLEEMVNGNKESGVISMPDVVTYNTIIDGLCKVGLVEKARQLFLEHMIQRGVVPHIYTYNILMNDYCLADRIGDAQKLFDSITRKGYRPNVVCYTTLINWYCKNKEVNEALSLYQEMISEGIRADVITHSTLLTGFFLIAEVKDARNLVGEMRLNDVFPDSWTYDIFINGLCKNGCGIKILIPFFGVPLAKYFKIERLELVLVQSVSLWCDCLRFVQEYDPYVREFSPDGKRKTVQRIRSVFHRQLSIPLANVRSTLLTYKSWEVDLVTALDVESGDLDGIPSTVATAYEKALEMYNAQADFEERIAR
ncbi:pentatricopeptide repeat-containing protein At1g62680, mitochondrial-like [Pistacia vera]|uniref:pentatricopeptide repeat-containing protein At1g62680, mitochondrial-like n=1 Tax=Pistacia vera TaxID=55513 RepID=UPI001263A304|nr:pentatricopeptide repeat-containing protein At1g62680, mitochondrial-like [Pistacia vera]